MTIFETTTLSMFLVISDIHVFPYIILAAFPAISLRLFIFHCDFKHICRWIGRKINVLTPPPSTLGIDVIACAFNISWEKGYDFETTYEENNPEKC